MAIPQDDSERGAKPKRHQARASRQHVWKDKHYRWVPTADGDWRVQGYIVRHKHKPPRHHYRGPGPEAARTAAPSPAAVNRDPRPAGAYQGPFGPRAGDAAARPGRVRRRPGPGRAARLARAWSARSSR